MLLCVWQMRARARYQLPSGTEQEAWPCSKMHIGPPHPVGWFSREFLVPDLIFTPVSHRYLELLVEHFPIHNGGPPWLNTAPFHSLK